MRFNEIYWAFVVRRMIVWTITDFFTFQCFFLYSSQKKKFYGNSYTNYSLKKCDYYWVCHTVVSIYHMKITWFYKTYYELWRLFSDSEKLRMDFFLFHRMDRHALTKVKNGKVCNFFHYINFLVQTTMSTEFRKTQYVHQVFFNRAAYFDLPLYVLFSVSVV